MVIVAYSRLGNFAARKWLQNWKVRQGIAGSALAVGMNHDGDVPLTMQERLIPMATADENFYSSFIVAVRTCWICIKRSSILWLARARMMFTIMHPQHNLPNLCAEVASMLRCQSPTNLESW